MFNGFKNEKLNTLEQAINKTNDMKITLNMQTLGRVIICARDFPKLSRADKDRFKELTLDQWVNEVNKEK